MSLDSPFKSFSGKAAELRGMAAREESTDLHSFTERKRPSTCFHQKKKKSFSSCLLEILIFIRSDVQAFLFILNGHRSRAENYAAAVHKSFIL